MKSTTIHPFEPPREEIVRKERYKLCPSCGNFAHMAQRQEYCTVCGEKLIAECGNCREPIVYPTARFCPACGCALVKPKAATRETEK
jgi:predicted RNA-binding Zn-ribbon protein involved in translation (DUF1610 family)